MHLGAHFRKYQKGAGTREISKNCIRVLISDNRMFAERASCCLRLPKRSVFQSTFPRTSETEGGLHRIVGCSKGRCLTDNSIVWSGYFSFYH